MGIEIGQRYTETEFGTMGLKHIRNQASGVSVFGVPGESQRIQCESEITPEGKVYTVLRKYTKC